MLCCRCSSAVRRVNAAKLARCRWGRVVWLQVVDSTSCVSPLACQFAFQLPDPPTESKRNRGGSYAARSGAGCRPPCPSRGLGLQRHELLCSIWQKGGSAAVKLGAASSQPAP